MVCYIKTMLLRSALARAVEVPAAAARFYRRHAVWVVGISLIPGLQRFASTLSTLPAGIQGLLEPLTLVARLALLGLIASVAFRGGRRGAPLRFLREQWLSLIMQAVMLACAIGLFSIALEHGVPAWLPMFDSPLYTAIVLLVKNLTVIAFVFIWLVLAVRQISWHGADEASAMGLDQVAS